MSQDTWGVFGSRWTGANNIVSLDGVDGTSSAYSTSCSPALGRVGADNQPSAPSEFLNGYIAELVVINRALTSDERAGLLAYFKAKYNTP